MFNFKKNAGFTLIELMVVILIIVILGTLGLVSYAQATKSARDAKRKSDIETVKQAMILYRQDVGTYPVGDYATITSSTNANGLTHTSRGYLSLPAPQDPDTANPYTNNNSTTTTFCLCADIIGTNGNATNATCANLGTATGTFYCAQQP